MDKILSTSKGMQQMNGYYFVGMACMLLSVGAILIMGLINTAPDEFVVVLATLGGIVFCMLAHACIKGQKQ